MVTQERAFILSEAVVTPNVRVSRPGLNAFVRTDTGETLFSIIGQSALIEL